MSSSGKVLLAAALAAAPLGGQAGKAPPPPAEVPAGFAARVRAAVASTWRTDTAGLVLSWGAGSLRSVADTAPFRLLGAGESGWFVLLIDAAEHAPRAVRIRAGLNRRQAVAARALRPGSPLAADDLRWEPRLRWGAPPAVVAPTPEAGWIVRRMVSAGEPLESPRVTPPPVVSMGQPVRVLWTSGNVSLALAGVALNDAGLGDQVRVRTDGRMGVIRATASGPDEARMP